MTCPTAGAVIRYSTTGSDPALTDGTVAHGGTIRVRHSMTLKAKAWLGAQSSPVASGTYTITGAIAAGSEHMLALKFDRNRVWSWGSDANQQLGNGSATGNQPTAVVVLTTSGSLANIAAIGSGETHSLFVTHPGQLFGAGLNAAGQLGLGTTTNQNYATGPALFQSGAAMDQVVAATGGKFHTIALRGNGTVWTSGSNHVGQLGIADSSIARRVYFNQVKDSSSTFLSNVAAIASGRHHGIALNASGQVWTWGSNSDGQLGLGDSAIASRYRAYQVTGLSGVTAIGAGAMHSFAIIGSGSASTLYGWGRNSSGQLGSGTTNANGRQLPQLVKSSGTQNFLGAIAVTGGVDHTLILRGDGSVWAVGGNSNGQLGDGTTAARSYPVQVRRNTTTTDFLENAVAIAAGENFSAALDRTGLIWTWGKDASGQLGNGNATGNQLYASGTQHTPRAINTPPTVEIAVTPSAATSTFAPADFTLTATPYDAEDNVTSVEFFRDGSSLGTSGTPYTVSWNSVPAGSYNIAARASDTEGFTGMFSAAVPVTVTAQSVGVTAGNPGSVSEGLTLANAFLFARGFAHKDPMALQISGAGSATAGADYTALPSSITIPALQTTGTLSLVTIHDQLIEPSETVIVSIVPGQGPNVNPASATVTITDQPQTVGVAALAPATVPETVGTGTFRFTRKFATANPLAFSYSVGGSATAGADYIALSGSGTIPANQTFVNIPVTGILDYEIEGDEDVAVTVQSGSNYLIETGSASASITIEDRPPLAVPSFYPPPNPYVKIETVWISGSAGQTIRYTTDGTDPTDVSPSLSGSGVVRLGASGVLKAKVYAPGQTPSVALSGTFSGLAAVAVGTTPHVLAIHPTGTLYAWGANGNGAVGTGTAGGSTTIAAPIIPKHADGSPIGPVSAVSAGLHSLALGADGVLRSWGNDSWSGALGRTPPVLNDFAVGPFSGAADVKGFAAGRGLSTFVITGSNRALWGCGNNGSRQVTGVSGSSSQISLTPVRYETGVAVEGIVQVVARDNSTFAVRDDGRVLAWGGSRLGDGTTTSGSVRAVKISGTQDLTGAVAVAVGSDHGLALLSSGSVYSWGNNGNGQLGVGGATSQSPYATPVLTGTNQPLAGVVAICAGEESSFFLRQNGEVWVTGRNDLARLGIGDYTNRWFATKNPALSGIVALSFREGVGFAFRASGFLQAWGNGWNGIRGDGNLETATRPTPATLYNHLLNTIDADQDGLSDVAEIEFFGTDPYNPDTNGDGLSDSANVYSGQNAASLDVDGDGLSNAVELAIGTNPFHWDTDGDGVGDGDDWQPLNPLVQFAPPPDPGDTVPPVLTITFPTQGISQL